MTQFYVLGKISPGPYETWYVPMDPHHTGDAQYCPECEKCISSLEWLPPYHVKLEAYQSKLGDVTSQLGGTLLVSARFRQAWEERQLVGIQEFGELDRIRVRPARLGKPTPIYYRINPQMFGAAIDFSRSHFKYGGIITCNKCRSMPGFKKVRGFTIEDGSWTGEDLFRPWGFTGTIVVTDRVRQLRDDYDLKNVELTPTEEYIFPPDYKAEE